MTPTLYNPILDGEQFHNDEVAVIGTPQTTPIGESYSHITGKFEPYGGHPSTAIIRGQRLDAVNVVAIDTEAAARRNLKDIRASITSSLCITLVRCVKEGLDTHDRLVTGGN